MKITDHASFKENPFEIEGIKEVSIYSKEDVQIVTNINTGEIFEQKKSSKSKIYHNDTLPYTKVYHNSASSIKEFSIPALKIWSFILQYLKPNTNYVDLYMEDVREYTGYSGTSNIYKGIIQLLELEFISRKVGTSVTFWINPNKMFNGKRM